MQYDHQYEPLIISKALIDLFIKEDNTGDLIALYTFYYYTAKWQHTNTAKATTAYTAEGLDWTDARVRKAKKTLLRLGLISDFQNRDESGKVTGHYVYVRFIWSDSKIKEIQEQKTTLTKNQGVENRETNALSDNNRNALSDDREDICPPPKTSINRPKRSTPPIKNDTPAVDERYKAIATALHKIMSKHYPNNIVTPAAVNKWVTPISKIFKVWKGTPEQLLAWLRVYYEHYERTNKFHPVIQSGEGLLDRIKNGALERFVDKMKQEHPNQIYPSGSPAKPVVTNVETVKRRTRIADPNASYVGQQIIPNFID